jgi:hypothetical protein
MQAAIDAAVQATSAAQTTSDSTVAVATPIPTAVIVTEYVTQMLTETVYVPQDVYMTMTEEELAALIDDAVDEATAATLAYSSAATAATTDGAVTTTEVDTVAVYVQLAEETVVYAEELLTVYSDLYGTNTAAIVNAVAGVEAELATITESTAAMATALIEIESTLDAGLTLAEETITQVETAAATATANAQAAVAQSATLVGNVQAEVATYQETLQGTKEDFTSLIQSAQPQVVAATQAEVLRDVFTYADSVRGALADNQISSTEMQQIAQLGANAVAGINSQGGRFSTLSPALTDVSKAIARGDLSGARQGLGQVEAQLPSRDNLGAVGAGANGDRPAVGGNRPGTRPDTRRP